LLGWLFLIFNQVTYLLFILSSRTVETAVSTLPNRRSGREHYPSQDYLHTASLTNKKIAIKIIGLKHLEEETLTETEGIEGTSKSEERCLEEE